MGAYYYVTSPKLVALARVRWADGSEGVETVALYRYAYKPYRGWNASDAAMNRRMHFKFGAAACEAAYKRSAKSVPAFGICFDADTSTLYALTGDTPSNRPFNTRGLAGGLDDYEFANYENTPTILEYLELPKGLTVAEPRKWEPV